MSLFGDQADEVSKNKSKTSYLSVSIGDLDEINFSLEIILMKKNRRISSIN